MIGLRVKEKNSPRIRKKKESGKEYGSWDVLQVATERFI